ncbi:hypothetical protein ACVINW_003685 [Bradyrhizobium sp. USDA 4461]
MRALRLDTDRSLSVDGHALPGWRSGSLQLILILKVVLQPIVDKFCQSMIAARQRKQPAHMNGSATSFVELLKSSETARITLSRNYQ